MKPNTDKLAPIVVRLSDVGRAVERAKTLSTDWQAQLCEILLIPQVYARWHEINDYYTLERVDGIPYSGTREQNIARGKAGKWNEVNGYILGPAWNSVKPDWYSHGASTTWNGLQRETYSRFVQDIHISYSLAVLGKNPGSSEYLQTYKVELENDL